MLQQLDDLIREIDFCVEALNLSLTLVSTTALQDPDLTYPRMMCNIKDNNNNNRTARHKHTTTTIRKNDCIKASESDTNTDGSKSRNNFANVVISPSLLLQASNRIQVMHDSGGDVAVCFGQLFRKSFINNHNTNNHSIYSSYYNIQPRWQRMYVFFVCVCVASFS